MTNKEIRIETAWIQYDSQSKSMMMGTLGWYRVWNRKRLHSLLLSNTAESEKNTTTDHEKAESNRRAKSRRAST